LEGVFRYGDTAQPFPDDVTITDHELTTADGATIRLRWPAPGLRLVTRSLPVPRQGHQMRQRTVSSHHLSCRPGADIRDNRPYHVAHFFFRFVFVLTL
jgi:hypothetical protein